MKELLTKVAKKDLGGTAVMDEPLDDRSALLLELEQAPKNWRVRAYRLAKPSAPTATVVRYPRLLADGPQLAFSRNELKSEVRLLLERKQQIPLQEDTYVYSVRVLSPAPFQPSEQLRAVMGLLPEAIADNAGVGYLTHDALYGLMADEGRLLTLLDAFLSNVTEVEIKVRRAPEDQRSVSVTLAE